ncbi:MAG: sulfatase-like hydrolase/transferase, partial [Anaerolineae bacterium]
MRKSDGLRCISTGLLVGLGWGLFAALSEGLPLLLQGSLWAFLGERLLALAYLATIYGALCGLAGGLSGLVALVVLRLARRRTSRTALAATLAGLFAAATLVVWWAHRFAPRALEWVVILGLAAGAGLAVGWGLHRVARGGAVSRKAFRSLVLVGFLAAGLAVLAVAGFRAKFRDLPLFNPPTADGAATAEQPNIVLITAGGVRPDRLGVYGSDPAISPNIDALAWRGIRFEQAYAQAAWSEPSLASLLTSLYPSGLGIDCRAAIHCTPHLDAQRTTLAEALQGAGYRTQAYLTSPWLSAELGFDQGFDGFESIRPEEPFDLGPMRSQTLGRLLGCRQDSTACQRFSEGHARLFDAPIPLGWGGDHVNARVTRFLDLYGGERFFLW